MDGTPPLRRWSSPVPALAVVAAVGDFPNVAWRGSARSPSRWPIVGFAVSLLAAAEIWAQDPGGVGGRASTRDAALRSGSSPGSAAPMPTSLLLPVLRAAMAERGGVPGRVTLASMAYEVSPPDRGPDDRGIFRGRSAEPCRGAGAFPGHPFCRSSPSSSCSPASSTRLPTGP